MPQSLARCAVHLDWSTRDREPFLHESIRPRVYELLKAAAYKLESPCIGIGGVDDHVHMLVLQSRNVALKDLVGKIKSGSSSRIKDLHKRCGGFAWQAGYGAFSISPGHEKSLLEYFARQEEHHRRVTFQEEFLRLLRRYDIPFDERYVWD